MRKICFLGCLVFLSLGIPAHAQFDPLSQLEHNNRGTAIRLTAPIASPEKFDYGRRSWQKVSLFVAEDRDPTPQPVAVLFSSISGRAGSYSMLEWLRYRLTEAGIALAVVPYRGLRERPGERLESYASAIAYLREHEEELGLDADRIVLAGVRREAHFAAVLATNPQFLETAGVPFSSLRGVLSLDGLGFDIEARMAQGDFTRSYYRRHFGRDPEDYLPYSPAAHLDAPVAPQFLFFANEENEDETRDSQGFFDLLQTAGTEAQFVIYPMPRGDLVETYPFVEEEGSGREVMPFIRSALGLAP